MVDIAESKAMLPRCVIAAIVILLVAADAASAASTASTASAAADAAGAPAASLASGERAVLAVPAADADVAAIVEALVRDRSDASARGDVERWRRRIADDCPWIGVGLAVQTTASVAEAQIGFVGRNEVEDFTARVHGDVAVATYLLVQHIGERGNERIVRLRKLDTYQRRNGEWWLVANAESLAPPPRAVVAVEPARLDRLAGEYVGTFSQKPVSVRVWREGTALKAQDSTSPEPFVLLPASDSAFFIEGEPAEWLFDIDAEGTVRALLYRAGGADLRFERARGPSH